MKTKTQTHRQTHPHLSYKVLAGGFSESALDPDDFQYFDTHPRQSLTSRPSQRKQRNNDSLSFSVKTHVDQDAGFFGDPLTSVLPTQRHHLQSIQLYHSSLKQFDRSCSDLLSGYKRLSTLRDDSRIYLVVTILALLFVGLVLVFGSVYVFS